MSTILNFQNDIPLGIEYGDYDNRISASSHQWEGYYAQNGKLNSSTCWCPADNDKNNHPWIQVNLGEEKYMTSVTLQGRKDTSSSLQYVTKFRVLYSKDGTYFEHLETFQGLNNVNETIKRWFTIPVFCRAIRIQVLEYNVHPSLRFEFGYIPHYLIQTKLKELIGNNETPK